jgi:succinoglycan biosynthesis transport protein ExoP
MPQVQQDPEALSLEQALGVLRRRVPLIALCVVVVAGAAFAYSKSQVKKYTATASLAFNDNQLSQQVAGLPAVNGDVPAQQASNLELVKLGDMAPDTASLLGHGLTAEMVADNVSVAGQGESSIVAVSATSTSPTLAAAIANTYVQQFVREQQTANRRYFKAALSLVDKQLAGLSRYQRVGVDGVALQDRAQTLRLLAELNYETVQIAQEAAVPAVASSPNTSRTTGLGVLLGLLIGLGLAFVLERLDHRTRTPEELEQIYGLPMLGAVPESSALARVRRPRDKRAVLPPTEAEAFSLIRAHLRFFNVDREPRTILIASASPGDGKTTIARHLAEAAARLGSRVLLLEADLRHPTLSKTLDIQPGPGLAEVLIGAIPIGEATHTVDLEAPHGTSTGRALDVLTASAVPPPNPAELLESRAMDVLLERAKSEYDYVLIDTPPLTAVPDAFPLLTKVDGVVIVGWVGHSKRDASERLHQVLASSGARLLGVIANGSKSVRSGVYGRPNEYRAVASANAASASDDLIPTAQV